MFVLYSVVYAVLSPLTSHLFAHDLNRILKYIQGLSIISHQVALTP